MSQDPSRFLFIRGLLLQILVIGAIGFLLGKNTSWATPVTNLTHTAVSSDSVSLQWDNQPGNNYQLTLSTVPGFSIQISSGISALNQNTTTYTQLEPNTSHTFLVKVSTDASTEVLSISTYTLVSPPGNFDVLYSSDIGISSITVRWDPNGNPLTPPTSYQVQYSTDSNFVVSSDSFTFLTTLSATNLIANTTYYFRARAYPRVGGPSSYNTTTSTPTLSSSPGFSGFQVYHTSLTVTIESNGNSGGTLFRLIASTDGLTTTSVSSQSLSSELGSIPSLTLSGLIPNSTYSVGIEAINHSNFVSSTTVVTTTVTLPNPPGNFSAFVSSDVATNSIHIQWDSNGNPLTPPTSYQLEISTSQNFVTSSSSFTFLTQATTSTLTTNTSYYFRVRAFGRWGDVSDYNSSVATFTLATTPTNLSSTQSVSSIHLTWTSNNPNSTRVEISSSTDNFALNISTPISFSDNFTGSATTFINLREGTSYFFRMRAINENNLPTSFSVTLNTRTVNILPESISNLSFDAAFGAQDGEIRWTWTAPGGDQQTAGTSASSYIVRYATFDISTAEFELPQVSTFSQSWTPSTRGNVEAQTVTGLNPGTTYFFAIKGVDQVGNIALWSTGAVVNANRSYFARDLPLSAPSNPQFSLITSSQIGLTWTNPSAPSNVDDRDSYRVYYATYSFSSTTDPFVIQSTGTTHPVSLLTVTGLQNETTYFFRVTALDQGDQGSGLFSHAIESSLSAATSTLTLDRIAPAGISDLTALTGPNEGEILLQWTAPGDDGTTKSLLSGSIFQLKYSSVSIITNANYDTPPSPSYTQNISTVASPFSRHGLLVSGLFSQTTYWFAIKTIDESSNISVWNSSADVASVNVIASTLSQRDNVAPGTVTGLSLTPAYERMNISWISPGDNGLVGNVTGFFRIKYGTAVITTDAEFNAAASTVTLSTSVASGVTVSTQIVNLVNNLTYYFYVKAIDDGGNFSPFSAPEVQNDFPRNQPPGAFTLAAPVDGFVVTTTPQNVSWNASTDPDSTSGDVVNYEVQYSTRSDFSSVTTTTESAGTLTNRNIAGALIEDSSTYWRVRAEDSDLAEVFSDTRVLRINTVNTAPSTFSLLIPLLSTTVTTLTPTFDWEDSIDPDPGDGISYTINISTNPTADGGTTASNLSTSTYTSGSLTENATYYWKVQVVSTNPFTGTDTIFGNATYSFVINSIPEAPNAFSLIEPSADRRMQTSTPTFVWQEATDNDPGDSVTYTLTVQNTVNAVIFSTTIPNIVATTYTLTTALSDNQPYTWSVSATSTQDGLSTTGTPNTGRVMKVDLNKELPAVVTLSTPTNSAIVNSTAPTLTWLGVTDPDNPLDYSEMDRVRYIVKIGIQSDYSDALGQQIFFSDTNGFDTQRTFALQDQTTYFWQVAAAGYQPIGPSNTQVHVDTGSLTGCTTIVGGGANECYSVSAQRSFIVSLTNTPPSQSNLLTPSSGSILTTNLPTFDWTDSTESDPAQSIDYNIQISTVSDFSVTSFEATRITGSSYTLTTPLLQNRTYFWRVQTQDRFGGGTAAGNPVSSVETYDFRIPILSTPKEPTGMEGTRSSDGNSFTISWSPVTQNTNGTAITDLQNYYIYRTSSTTGLGSGTPTFQVSSQTLSYVDNTISGGVFYYTIRAINTSFEQGHSSGTISINSTVLQSSVDGSVLVVPDSPTLEGNIEITIPEEVKSILKAANNQYGEDLKFDLALTNASGLKDAIYGVRVQIKMATSDETIENFNFASPIQIAFPFTSLQSPSFASPSRKGASAIESPEEVAVFWNNGVEWINLNGIYNSANNSVFVRTRLVGEFAAREVTKATEFKVFSVTPSKIFTPNGDGCNDIISILFQNPQGVSGVKGKIFDLHGKYITDLKTSSSFGTISFDARCAQPNLSDDTLIWDGKDSDGALVRKGIYIYQIEADGKAFNGTIVVAR